MEKISNEELEKLLEAGITIKDKEIEAEEINLEYTEYGYFENCHFTAPKVIFNKTNYGNKIAKEEINLIFKNCSFNILWIDKVKNFKSLKFSKTSSKKAVSISHSIINDFYFEKNVKISFGILINDCTFKKFNFSKNKFVQKGYIILDGNRFNKSVTMRENDFNRLTIMNHTSLSDLSFSDNKNGSLALISSSKFKGVKINTSNFYFRDCDFLDKFYFEKHDNLEDSVVKFEDCNFEKYSKFDNTKFNEFEILQSTFLDKVSFDNLETNSFIINQVTFSKSAYFDDLNKNNNKAIESWDRKTVRTIKQELQKTENRIDYNRFRSYELAAHYKELKFCTNPTDTIILWATKWSSNFGSWTRALGFTLLSGLFWYSILYRIENGGALDWDKTNEYFIGLFRFFLVTDFYNPLKEDRSYLVNGGVWLILILGKICIAFGIYEMVQSFRKFKA